MRMSEKCHNNNNYDHPLTSRRTDGVKKGLDLDLLKQIKIQNTGTAVCQSRPSEETVRPSARPEKSINY